MDAITFHFTELVSKVEFSVLEQIFIIVLFTFLFAHPVQENKYVLKLLYDLTCIIDVKFQFNRAFPPPPLYHVTPTRPTSR